jgi:hypothetical protein
LREIPLSCPDSYRDCYFFGQSLSRIYRGKKVREEMIYKSIQRNSLKIVSTISRRNKASSHFGFRLLVPMEPFSPSVSRHERKEFAKVAMGGLFVFFATANHT